MATAIIRTGRGAMVRASVGNGSKHQNADLGKDSNPFHDSIFSFSEDEESVRLFGNIK